MSDNPFGAFLQLPSRPSTVRPTDREQQLNHQALEQSVSVLQELLGNGDIRRGRAVEFFDDVTLVTTGTTIKHALKRRPSGYVVVYQSTSTAIYGAKDQWSDENVVLFSGAGSPVCSFFLF